MHFFPLLTIGQENSTTVTLQIVREQGFVGDLVVQLSTAPNFELPPSNRATENEDYILEKKTVIMAENATTISVTVTILPVSSLTTSLAFISFKEREMVLYTSSMT